MVHHSVRDVNNFFTLKLSKVNYFYFTLVTQELVPKSSKLETWVEVPDNHNGPTLSTFSGGKTEVPGENPRLSTQGCLIFYTCISEWLLQGNEPSITEVKGECLSHYRTESPQKEMVCILQDCY